MAKRKKAAGKSELKRLSGTKVFVAGRGKKWERSAEDITDLCTAEGATIQKAISEDTDLLVAMDVGSTGGEKKAAQLNKKGGSIEVLTTAEFFDRMRPTVEDVQSLVAFGKKGIERLNKLLVHCECYRSNLTGCESISLRGLDLSEFEKLNCIQLNGADLRDTNVYGVHAGNLVNVDCRKSHGDHLYVMSFKNCDCRQVKWAHFFLDSGSGRGKAIEGSDFTGADFSDSYFSYATAKTSKFCKVNFSRTNSSSSSYEACDFTQANFSEAEFKGTKFTKATKFVGAKFHGADMSSSDFADSDLSKADFTGARLTGCDFRKAKIDGANFKDAMLLNAKFDPAKISKAKNLKLPRKTKVKTGAACKAFEATYNSSEEYTLSAEILTDEGRVKIAITKGPYSRGEVGASYEMLDKVAEEKKEYDNGYVRERRNFSDRITASSPTNGLKILGEIWGHGQLQVDTVASRTKKCPLRGKALNEAALAAVTEVFGVETPTEEVLKTQRKASKAKSGAEKEALLAEIRGGKTGIAKFNKRDDKDLRRRSLFKFRGEDFTKAKLSGLVAQAADFSKCDFTNASMTRVKLQDTSLRDAKLVGANLGQADLTSAKLNQADFSDAKLKKASLAWSLLRKATFAGADLTGADLSFSQLEGANFQGAILKGVSWEEAVFDGDTVFPKGFKIPAEMQFRGTGHDPRLAVEAPQIAGGVDSFEDFMKLALACVEHGRLSKAMKMLKKDSFELFSDVEDDQVVGVVRSQTDAELVYSCRLTKAGQFSCCTQNLNPCGGLRGALCKHLLVLMVGLAKSEEIDRATAASWMTASRGQKPLLDKDGMAEVLLKYKGVESGDIDWRPTETVPEDYFSF